MALIEYLLFTKKKKKGTEVKKLAIEPGMVVHIYNPST
jgi:hypothetical protein